MDRQGREDGQVLARIVVLLLSLAALAAVASAYAASIHAPVDGRWWPASDENEAAQLAKIFAALARALAVPARQAVRAARWLIRRSFAFLCEAPAIPDGTAPRPRLADTS